MKQESASWNWKPLGAAAVVGLAAFCAVLILAATKQHSDASFGIEFVVAPVVAVSLASLTWAVLTAYALVAKKVSGPTWKKTLLAIVAGTVLIFWGVLGSRAFEGARGEFDAERSSNETRLRSLYAQAVEMNDGYRIGALAGNPATPADILVEISKRQDPPFSLVTNPHSPDEALLRMGASCEGDVWEYCHHLLLTLLERPILSEDVLVYLSTGTFPADVVEAARARIPAVKSN